MGLILFNENDKITYLFSKPYTVYKNKRLVFNSSTVILMCSVPGPTPPFKILLISFLLIKNLKVSIYI